MVDIKIIEGDITTLSVDAIINAANETLLGGGGVDGVIHYVAGPELKEECETLGGCKKGEAKITKGYNLPAKYVIHTVGPAYGFEGGLEKKILQDCYINSLEVAKKNNLRTVAFPAISTGAFRYPKDMAAKIAMECVSDYTSQYPDSFDQIIFVMFSEFDYLVYKSL
ncbi:MAG: macro domain-containing protein [Patescibacteria group bacterium]